MGTRLYVKWSTPTEKILGGAVDHQHPGHLDGMLTFEGADGLRFSTGEWKTDPFLEGTILEKQHGVIHLNAEVAGDSYHAILELVQSVKAGTPHTFSLLLIPEGGGEVIKRSGSGPRCQLYISNA